MIEYEIVSVYGINNPVSHGYYKSYNIACKKFELIKRRYNPNEMQLIKIINEDYVILKHWVNPNPPRIMHKSSKGSVIMLENGLDLKDL